MSFHDNSSPVPGDGQQISIMGNGMVQFGSDNLANVIFYKKRIPDVEKSRMAGRPIETSVDYVRIQHPGERDTVDAPVALKPQAPFRWPRQWAQFQKSQEQIPDGTPTTVLPYFIQHPEIPANLVGYGVYTLEQLANLSEHASQSIGMGVTQWRNLARDFLEKANKGVGIHQMEAALEKRDNEIETLKHQIAEQKALIDRLIAAQNGVPGAMIPTGPLPTGLAHAASVRAAQAAPQADWTVAQQPSQQLMGDLAPSAPPSAAFDWTAGLPGSEPPPETAPPQPTPRRRGRPPKPAAQH